MKELKRCNLCLKANTRNFEKLVFGTMCLFLTFQSIKLWIRDIKDQNEKLWTENILLITSSSIIQVKFVYFCFFLECSNQDIKASYFLCSPFVKKPSSPNIINHKIYIHLKEKEREKNINSYMSL